MKIIDGCALWYTAIFRTKILTRIVKKTGRKIQIQITWYLYRLVWDDSINTSHDMDKLSVQSKAAGLDRLSWQANIVLMLLKILIYIPNKNGSKNEIHISRESKWKLNEKWVTYLIIAGYVVFVVFYIYITIYFINQIP